MATSTFEVNGALIFILAISALLFLLIVFFMLYFLVRYRHSVHPVAKDPKKSTIFLEMGWITASLLISLAMFFYGLTGFDFLRSAPRNSIAVTVHARQWSWLFEYSNGKKSPDLVVPIDTNVRCDLLSADVIHGFYVPAFRIQQDALPGMKTMVWFKATQSGAFDILCSQYCGLRHSSMLAKLYAVPGDRFSKWLGGEEIELPGKRMNLPQSAGEKLLNDRGCLSCHSVTGATMVGPTFKGLFGSQVRVHTGGTIHVITADESYIRDSILTPDKDVVDGYQNIMPSGKDILNDDEIHEIIEYLESLK
jgi:cytochrome c oxidase subunit 2